MRKDTGRKQTERKRIMRPGILILSVMMFLVCVNGYAETEGEEGFFGSVGNFLTGIWNDAEEWAEGAWNDAASWAAGAWGDASQWIGQAWDDSSAWVTEIWGDVSTWTEGTYNSAAGAVEAWWVDTFAAVTDNVGDSWDWLIQAVPGYSAEDMELLGRIKEAAACDNDDAGEKVYSVFIDILGRLDMDEKDIERIRGTVTAYSEQKGINDVSAAKIMLPYLLQLKINRDAAGGTQIPAIAAAQYLTGVTEKLGIDNEEIAGEFILKLNDILSGI